MQLMPTLVAKNHTRIPLQVHVKVLTSSGGIDINIIGTLNLERCLAALIDVTHGTLTHGATLSFYKIVL